MQPKLTKLFIEWIMLIMYAVCSRPDVSQMEREAIGYKTKELTDELEKA